MRVQRHAPAAVSPGLAQHPLYRRLCELQGRSGRVRIISPSPGLDPRTVQSVASRYTDWAIPAHGTMAKHMEIEFYGKWLLAAALVIDAWHYNWAHVRYSSCFSYQEFETFIEWEPRVADRASPLKFRVYYSNLLWNINMCAFTSTLLYNSCDLA